MGTVRLREDAEDLVQETYERSCGGRLRHEDDLGYLYRAAPHLLQRAAHGLAGRRSLRSSTTFQTASWYLQPEQAAETNLVLEAVAALPEPMREVLVAVDVVGLSYAEAEGARRPRERHPQPACAGPAQGRGRYEDDQEAAEESTERGR